MIKRYTNRHFTLLSYQNLTKLGHLKRVVYDLQTECLQGKPNQYGVILDLTRCSAITEHGTIQHTMSFESLSTAAQKIPFENACTR